ncbi:MAG: histidine phosphatase family protein [Betaproteobacteria bacterium]|nr:histidine phosphatase family protein [Betaproteobacteria bacterium]
MNVYFMRHGQTNYNVRGLCNDDPSRDVHLTAQGVQQAEGAAQALREVPIEAILVSRLPRTRQTAEIVNRYHGVPITAVAALDDVHTGCEGRPVAMHREALRCDPMHARVDGGETLAEHKRRVFQFIDRLKARPEHTILVVAHEETLRVATAYFRGVPDEAMWRLHFDNADVVPFELEAHRGTRCG